MVPQPWSYHRLIFPCLPAHVCSPCVGFIFRMKLRTFMTVFSVQFYFWTQYLYLSTRFHLFSWNCSWHGEKLSGWSTLKPWNRSIQFSKLLTTVSYKDFMFSLTQRRFYSQVCFERIFGSFMLPSLKQKIILKCVSNVKTQQTFNPIHLVHHYKYTD